MKKEFNLVQFTIGLIACIILFVGVSTAIYNNVFHHNQHQECTQSFKIITGIKGCSAGGFLSPAICVYETDKGDISADSGYQTGDHYDIQTNCVWVND